MALTRAEAIDLAVMRHVTAKVGGLNRAGHDTFLHLMERAIRERIWQWEPEVTAIRAHFRAIVRTYGVLSNVVESNSTNRLATDWTAYNASVNYDGHSLRR